MFTIAAAFGNVHGVYSPGNVQLTPQILHNCQKFIKSSNWIEFEHHGVRNVSTM